MPFATSYMAGREDKRTNNRTMHPNLTNNAAAGCKGPVKIELLKVDLMTFPSPFSDAANADYQLHHHMFLELDYRCCS